MHGYVHNPVGSNDWCFKELSCPRHHCLQAPDLYVFDGVTERKIDITLHILICLIEHHITAGRLQLLLAVKL